jgi:hypothetical protein
MSGSGTEKPWGYTYTAGDNLATFDAYAPFIRQLSKRTLAAWGISLYPDQGGYAANGPVNPNQGLEPFGYEDGVPVPATGAPLLTVNGRYLGNGISAADGGLPTVGIGGLGTTGNCFSIYDLIGNGEYTFATTGSGSGSGPQKFAPGLSWRGIQGVVLRLLAVFYDPAAAGNTDPAYWNGYGYTAQQYLSGGPLPSSGCNEPAEGSNSLGSGSAVPEGTGSSAPYQIEDPSQPGYPLPLAYKWPYWPGPCGFTRKREREITSLGATGEPGQRARFVVWTSSRYQDPSPVDSTTYDVTEANGGLGELMPSTPADQYRYSTLLMDYGSGSGSGSSSDSDDGQPVNWHVSPDQVSDPDTLTFYGVAQDGDILGPWILNELYAAIEQLTMTGVRAFFPPGGSAGTAPGQTGVTWYSGWYECYNSSSGSSTTRHVGEPNVTLNVDDGFQAYGAGNAELAYEYISHPWITVATAPNGVNVVPTTGAEYYNNGTYTSFGAEGVPESVPAPVDANGPYASTSGDWLDVLSGWGTDPRNPDQSGTVADDCPYFFSTGMVSLKAMASVAVPVAANMTVTAYVPLVKTTATVATSVAGPTGDCVGVDTSSHGEGGTKSIGATTATTDVGTISFSGVGQTLECDTCSPTIAWLISPPIDPGVPPILSTVSYSFQEITVALLDWTAGFAATDGGYGPGEQQQPCDPIECVELGSVGSAGFTPEGSSSSEGSEGASGSASSGGSAGGGGGGSEGGGGSTGGSTSSGSSGSGGTTSPALPTTGPDPGDGCDHRITGTPISGGGASDGGGDTTVANAFDDNPATYVIGGEEGGGWVGVDYGETATVTSVAFIPASGSGADMVGGSFQVSSTVDFSSDVHTIGSVATAPADGVYTIQALTPAGLYQYARYLAPSGVSTILAELQFYGCSASGGGIGGGSESTGSGGSNTSSGIDGSCAPVVYQPDAITYPGTAAAATNLGTSSAFDITGAITLAAVVNASSYPTGGTVRMRIVGKQQDSSASNGAYLLCTSSYGGVALYLYKSDGSYTGFDGSTPLPTDEDVFVAATWDGESAMRVYVNGVAQTGYTFDGPIGVSTEPLEIGGAQLDAQAFVGTISDVFVFPCCLTGDQITALYDSEAP